MSEDQTKKRCWKCKADKTLDNFARGSLDSVCKTCRYLLNAEWAKNNREKLRPKRAEYMRAYRLKKSLEKKSSEQNIDPLVPPVDPTKI